MMKNDVKGTLRKHEEENKLISSSNNKRKINDVWNAIRCALSKKKRRHDMLCEEEEEMSKKSSKRKRNDMAIHHLVNKRRKMMLNYMKSSSSNRKRKRSDNDAGEGNLSSIDKKRKKANTDAEEGILSSIDRKEKEANTDEEEEGEEKNTTTTTPLVINIVNKRRRKMMLNYMKSSSSNRKRKRSDNDAGEGNLSSIDKKRKKANTDEHEGDAEEGILSSIDKKEKKANTYEEEKEKEEEEKNTTTPPLVFNIGDTVNLLDLLFTKKRNFLINSNKQRVEAKDLSGKFVVLYFMSLTPYDDYLRTITKHLLDIYSKLQPRGDFEIVLVAIDDHVSHYYQAVGMTPVRCFRKLFSTMPWPAIPFSDLESRKRLESIFLTSTSVIIDPRGVVLQCDANPLFLRYGAAAYPFTNERIQSIDSEDNLLLTEQPLSIKKLLATPERDYVINSNGDQVPLDGLDHKVVGLYFCPCLDVWDLRTTRTLKKLHQELSENTKEFEIVLIYTHGWCDHEDTCGRMAEDSFLNKIKTMPWLALPYKDTDCNKKLQRLFQHPQELKQPIPARLVIIGPHGKFIEPLGTHILQHYGAQAYPFSLQSAANLEHEMLKKLKLEMFWDLDTVFTHRNGSQVRFSQYVGKRVIVIFQNFWWESNGLWRDLKARYFRMKGTDDEFEVIHICKVIYANYNKKIEAPMPWFTHPHLDQDSYASKYMDHVSRYINCVLFAFDRDGSVVGMKRDPELGDNMMFPFCQDGNMENEVLLLVREYIKCELECVNDDRPFN